MNFVLDPQVGDGLNYRLITPARLSGSRLGKRGDVYKFEGFRAIVRAGLTDSSNLGSNSAFQSCEGAAWLWARASSHFSYSAFIEVPGFSMSNIF
jgi:hypothetical protein